MTSFAEFALPNGWTLAGLAVTVVLGLFVWRRRAQTARRERRRIRNIARQRTWDWLMVRRNVKRLTHHKGE